MDNAEQMQDYRRDFDAINENFEKLLNNSDSLHQVVQNLDRRLADVEEKQEVNLRSSDHGETRLKYCNSQGAELLLVKLAVCMNLTQFLRLGLHGIPWTPQYWTFTQRFHHCGRAKMIIKR